MRLVLMSFFMGGGFALTVISDAKLVHLFRLALKLAGYPEKCAYSDMGMSQPQFSKQMNGEEPPRFLSRIGKIEDPEVIRWYALLLSDTAGAPSILARAQAAVDRNNEVKQKVLGIQKGAA